jgi:Holliday junction resolvase
MAQRESKLSRKIMDELRKHGWYAFKIHGGPTMTAGLPDIMVCAQGVFIGLETKNPEDRANVSVRQRLTHKQMSDAGAHIYVVCSPSEAVSCVHAALIAQSSRKLSLENKPTRAR